MSLDIITENRVPVIVESLSAFTDTLFRPIDGRTADGYVYKRGKRYVDIFLAGKKIRVNQWLVPCIQCPKSGRWFHGILDIPFSIINTHTAFRALAIGNDWYKDGSPRYFFN